MKKISKLIAIATVSTSLNAFADVCVEQHGTMHCTSGTVNEINYTGIVDLDGTTVTGVFKVLGNADIQDGHLTTMYVRGVTHLEDSNVRNSMEIIGNLSAKKSEITGTTKIVGDLNGRNLTFGNNTNIVGTINCDQCVFKQDALLIGDVTLNNSQIQTSLLLNAKNSLFSTTKLNDITVKKPTADEQQEIQLKNGSLAHNITFENQKGIVVLDSTSKITGAVVGGKVVTR
jgi:hypothetical protein